MLLSLIVAMSKNRVIGRDNRLPWHLPDDLKRFKQTTLGHAVIMGRKTFESIGKPLPGRRNIVITRDPTWSAPGVQAAHSVDEAVRAAGDDAEAFIIGGAEIFRETLPIARRLYLTNIEAEVDGDAFFPPVNWNDWRLIHDEPHAADERHALPFRFQVFERMTN